MAIGLLAVKRQEQPISNFIHSAANMVEHRPEALTDKWVEDINNWCEQILSGMELGEQEDISPGDSIVVNSVTVVKRRSNKWRGFPALITKDDNGWKYWMVWPKAFDFAVGDKVDITGTVRDIRDGMIFLTRPSSVALSK